MSTTNKYPVLFSPAKLGSMTVKNRAVMAPMSNPAVTGFINYSASDISIYPDRPTRAMTLDEIKRLREMYVEKALLLQRAGFDGAEIHAAHGYLLSQFLSPYHNRRTDDYGGSFENRFRLLREIIEDVRSAVGGRFVLTVRFPGDKFAKDRSPLHMDAEDGLRIAKAIEATGKVDALNISYGNAYNPNANCEPYSYKEGWKCETAKRIKDSVSLPTMSTNTIKGPELAERVLEDGVSDFVVLGRSLLADPHFMKKAYTGHEDDIRRCMGCMHCRAGMSSVGLQCAVNPTLMREVTHGEDKLRHDGNGAPVAVVGGGPAGMQAAQTLAKRGFDVTLYEKSDAMGGSMNAADKAPCKDKMTRMRNTTVLVRHRLTAVTATGVACLDLETGRQVDVEADSVVLALGAVPDAALIGRFCDYFGTQAVHLAGDANSPGKIADATRDAYLKAFNFSL